MLHNHVMICVTTEQMEYLGLINLISLFSEEWLINEVFTYCHSHSCSISVFPLSLMNSSESNVLRKVPPTSVSMVTTDDWVGSLHMLMRLRHVCTHAVECSHRTDHSLTSSSPLRYLEQSTVGSKSGQWALHPGWAVRLTMPCSVLSRLGSP